MYGFFKTKNINIYFYGLYKNTFFLLVCAFKGIWIYIWKHMQETYIFHPCDAVFNMRFLLVTAFKNNLEIAFESNSEKQF